MSHNALQRSFFYHWIKFLIKFQAIVFKKTLLLLIKAYQWWLSPFLGPACRFYPTCSEYAYEAVHRYGIVKGVSLSIRRLLKCQPFHSGGYDPVP